MLLRLPLSSFVTRNKSKEREECNAGQKEINRRESVVPVRCVPLDAPISHRSMLAAELTFENFLFVSHRS